MRSFVVILASFAALAVCDARVITVDDDGPADFATIQAAIDDANDGDTVLVADGTYTGPGNRGIDYKGKAIVVRSQNGPQTCIINCQRLDRGFVFQRGEDANSLLEGVTIANGRKGGGGGILFSSSSPTISNCIITNCEAPYVSGFPVDFATSGGGISSSVSSPLILNCVITNNTATDRGGGISCYSAGNPGNTPTLRNCIIAGNTANIGGALYRCRGEITTCTIVGNSATVRGGGVYDCWATITNCIIWGNGDDLYLSSAKYSCIEDGDAGEGNIAANPCFADSNSGDYHLKSQGGRWDVNEGRWTIDDVTSPCIDGGDPMTPIGAEPFPNGGIINMGAYGGTVEASKSYFGTAPCETIVAGDVNGDCIVDYRDLAIALMHWLEEG